MIEQRVTVNTTDRSTKDIKNFVNKHSKLLESSLSSEFTKAIKNLDTGDKELNEIEDLLESYVDSMKELSRQMKIYKTARKKYNQKGVKE